MVSKETAVAKIYRPTATEMQAAFVNMMNTIPIADDSDAEWQIMAEIFGAETLEDSNDRWNQSDEALQLVGEEFVIDSVVRRPSTKGDDKDYLFCQVRRGGPTGPTVRWSTSSTACQAVILRANAEGRIPGLHVKHKVAEKQTAAGQLPRHLEVIGQAEPILG